MRNEEMKSQKYAIIILMVVVTAIAALFLFLFFNCIRLYQKFDSITYDDLYHEEVTFDRFKKISKGKGGAVYEIHVKEYANPFQVDNISSKKLNKTSLKELKENEKLQIYFSESSHKDYDYVLCEVSRDTDVLLSLSDYIKTNRNNQLLGMIISPILVLSCALLFIVFIKIIITPPASDNLGKLKIEYKTRGDVIRIYNATSVCSLMINGIVVDRYFGFVTGNFTLSGKIKRDGQIIPVEARMGALYITLYYDGKAVAKKFMGLG